MTKERPNILFVLLLLTCGQIGCSTDDMYFAQAEASRTGIIVPENTFPVAPTPTYGPWDSLPANNPLVGTWITWAPSLDAFDTIIFYANGSITGKYYPFEKTNSKYSFSDSLLTIYSPESDGGIRKVSKKMWFKEDTITFPYYHKADSADVLWIHQYNSFWMMTVHMDTPLFRKKNQI